MEIKELVEELNRNLDEPYKFHLDKIMCNDNYKIQTIGQANSILNDWANIPQSIKLKIVTTQTGISINKWINRKLWTYILENLCNEKLTDLNARFVRLRIAVNMSTTQMAYKLSKDEMEEWRLHLTELFYKRCFAINQYYCKEIIQLPFLD